MTNRKWIGRMWASVLAGVILGAMGLEAGGAPPAADLTAKPGQLFNAQPATTWGRDDAAHLLRRAGFSGRGSSDIEEVRKEQG